MRKASRLKSATRGQIVIGWLLKLVIGLLLVGLLLFEVVGVVVARATAADTASKAAQEAGFRYRDTGDTGRAEEVARQFAEKEGAEFVSISIDPQGRTTTVTVRKKATTFLIQNIGPLRQYTEATSTQTVPLPG